MLSLGSFRPSAVLPKRQPEAKPQQQAQSESKSQQQAQPQVQVQAKATAAKSSVPTAPKGASISDNMKTAYMYRALPLAIKLAWFKSMVESGGPWDYKTKGMKYEDFGNFNYGATGRALGIPLDTLLRAAGAYQIYSGTSKPEWGKPWGKAPYGDEPNDQTQIRNGYNYAKGKGY